MFTVPIYEYQCDGCSHKFEVIQKVSDALLTECPACKQNKLRKMVTAAAFRLKGGGWYETDFKDKKLQKNIIGGETSGSADKKNEKSSSGDSNSSSSETKTTTADKGSSETKSSTTPAASTPKPSADS